ncbi:MAG: hypothetical protein LAN61_07160 [Acidobacteriia bacterium]|nr:hypothetical protein [Terriglobia bacterium]
MTWTFLSFVLLVAALLALLGWSLRQSRGQPHPSVQLSLGADSLLHHAVHFPQIRQALSPADWAFLAARGTAKLARRATADRRRAAIEYLDALHRDLRGLLWLARVLAALSPEVAARQEAERLWLAVCFECRYQMVRGMFLLGLRPQWQLQRVTEMVGALSARLDAAMAEMGERALQALEPASGDERRGMNLV